MWHGPSSGSESFASGLSLRDQQEKKDALRPSEKEKVLEYHERISDFVHIKREHDLAEFDMLALLSENVAQLKIAKIDENEGKSERHVKFRQDFSLFMQRFDAYLREKKSELTPLRVKSIELVKDQLGEFETALTYDFKSYPIGSDILSLIQSPWQRI